MDYVKLGPFKVKVKILEVTYRLNLLEKIRIYPIGYIAILKPVHGNSKPPVYKVYIYRGQEEDK